MASHTLIGGDASAPIKDVRAVAVRVPLARPVRIATRAVEAREYTLVWIETEDGTVGVGHAYAGTRGGRILRDIVLELFRPVLIGADATLIEQLWSALYQEALLLGRRGAVLRALSAVDIALWDRLGVAAGLPLYRLLGGERAEVHAYASGGYYTDGDPLASVEQELRGHVEAGFDAVKIKVGRDFALDVERVRVARERLGPIPRLALDANNAWRYPHDAIRFARAVERYDPWWLEEPLPADDIGGHAEVARTLDLPVATGEIHSTRWDFAALIEQRAADILQPDASVVGGISEWLKVAHLAAAAGLPVAPHWDHALHVQLAAAVGNCLAVEYFFLAGDVYNFDRLIREEVRLRPRGGRLQAPDRPGVGIVFDEAAVERFRIDGDVQAAGAIRA